VKNHHSTALLQLQSGAMIPALCNAFRTNTSATLSKQGTFKPETVRFPDFQPVAIFGCGNVHSFPRSFANKVCPVPI
jgi:hypothetical protein